MSSDPVLCVVGSCPLTEQGLVPAPLRLQPVRPAADPQVQVFRDGHEAGTCCHLWAVGGVRLGTVNVFLSSTSSSLFVVETNRI